MRWPARMTTMTIDYYRVVVATPAVGSGGRSFPGVFYFSGELEGANAHSHAPRV